MAKAILPNGLGDITGLIRKNLLQDTAVVLCEDYFDEDSCGWVTLATPSTIAGINQNSNITYPVTRITYRGIPRMILRTDDVSSCYAMMIKRLSNIPEAPGQEGGRYLVEMLVVPEQVESDVTRPQDLIFGLDTDTGSGKHRFFQFRWRNWDPIGLTQVSKWQICTDQSANSFVDLNGGAPFTWPTNENKAMPVYMAFVVNLYSGMYEGFRVGSGSSAVALGSLAATPDSSLVSLGVMGVGSALPYFIGGINPAVTIVNRSDASITSGAVGLAACRVTYLNNGQRGWDV